MEVGLPSGFQADSETFPSIKKLDKIKRIETQEGDTNVVIYFDRVCFCKSKSVFEMVKIYFLIIKLICLHQLCKYLVLFCYLGASDKLPNTSISIS